jgi:photosystem II stability/assembly factor-like uncharacterized protein
MPSARGSLIGLAFIALATTLSYALTWYPVDQQPAGGVGYDVSAGKETVFVCVKPAGIDADARVYRSTTAGSAWEELLKAAGFRAVEAFPTRPHIVYAGGLDLGVWKSTDGGDNWAPCTSGMGAADITTIAVAPSDTEVVYAADGRGNVGGGRGPVYRTTNGGGLWVDVTPDVSPYRGLDVYDIAVDAASPDTVLLCCMGQNQDYRGIYRTTDGGTSWTQPYNSQSVYSIAISHTAPAVAYAGLSSGIMKSTDGGQNWTTLQSAPSGGTYSLAVHPNDDEMVYALVSGSGVWRSTNGGASWSQCAAGMLLTSVEHARVCIDNANPDTLYAGEWHAGLYGTTDAGSNWQQVSTWMPCRDIRKLIAEDSGGYYWAYDDEMVLDVTADGGSGWVSTTFFGPSAYVDMVHPVADTMLLAKVSGDPVGGEDVAGFGIVRSTDRGYTWYSVFDTASGNNSALYQFGVAPSDPERVYGATSVGGGPRILKSMDCGSNWTFPEYSYGTYPYNAVAVSADDPDLVYFGCRDGRVVVSYDGGVNVVPFGNPLPSLLVIRRLVVGVGGLTLYAATPNGVYVTDNGGQSWELRDAGMTCRNIVDLVMAPNGTSLWAASYGPIAGPHVYVSYDGAAHWTEEVQGLGPLADVYSLSFDSDGWLHAGTTVGVFTCNEAPLPPIGPDATYPNWGRKLARDPDNGILHLAYTGTNVVYYKRSTDGGTTWSTPEPIGTGRYPAIALNGLLGEPDGLYPWVVYLTPQGSIIRAIRYANGAWDRAVIFQGSLENSAGAPSVYPDVVVAPYTTAYVTYPVYVGSSPTLSYIYFNSFTQVGKSQPEVVDGPRPENCYGASVVANPAAYIHVCWIRGQRVYYSQRPPGPGIPWSLPVPVSSPQPNPYVTEPASNPSMEAWGDSVFCVWRGPDHNGGFPGDVWRRDKWLPIPWESPSSPSWSTGLESDFPVMGTYYATFWHEQVPPDNYDPWVRLVYSMPQYLFQTPLISRYPHVYCHFPTMTSFRCDAVWTEQISVTPPLYEVMFCARQWGLFNLADGNGEIASYYAAKLGQPEPSPYCLSRGGYGNLDSWNADTSGAVLSYELPYLNPRMVYMLRAVLYHKGKESWDADIRCDSGTWHRIHVGPNAPDTFWLRVPKALYRDARIVVDVARVSGDYVSLAGLKLYQLEPEPNGRGGVQSTAGVHPTCLLDCAPNPISRTATVSYELGQAGPVQLTVHDATGRLVRHLESGYRSSGKYQVSWNATDDRERRMPAGVYFLRFYAGGLASSRRVTLVR